MRGALGRAARMRGAGLFALPMLALTVYTLFAFGTGWTGQWMQAADTLVGGTVLTAPLTAAWAAHLALSQRGLGELAASTPLRVWVPFRVAWLAWSGAASVFALVGGCALAITLCGAAGEPTGLWVLPWGLAVLAVGALAGVVAVRCWPHRMMVLLIGPTFFAVGAFGPLPWSDLIRQGPVGASLSGVVFDPGYHLAQALGLAGLCAVLAAGLLPWAERAVRLAVVLIAMAGAASVIASGLLVEGRDLERLAVSQERPTACAGSRPAICLAPSDERWLDRTRELMVPLLAALADSGARPPDRFSQLLPGYTPPVSEGMINPVDLDGGAAWQQAAENVATPAACPAYTDSSRPPPESSALARHLIGAWALARAGQAPGEPWLPREAAWLADPQRAEARAWVRSVYARLSDCELDRIPLPWRG